MDILNRCYRSLSQPFFILPFRSLATRSLLVLFTYVDEYLIFRLVIPLHHLSNKLASFRTYLTSPNKQTTIFREDTSALAGFLAGPLSWSNWYLDMLVFVEGRKPENPEKKNLKARSEPTTNSTHMAPGRHRNRATLTVGEHSHHCAIPAPRS